MTSEQLKDRLQIFLRSLDIGTEALRIANDVKDAVRDRVQTSGQNRQGRPFVPYTPGYAQRRRDAGFQIRVVDFTRSGELWGSIRARKVAETQESAIVEVGPTGSDNVDKVAGAIRKRGLIILPSDDELDAAYQDWVIETYEHFLRTIGA